MNSNSSALKPIALAAALILLAWIDFYAQRHNAAIDQLVRDRSWQNQKDINQVANKGGVPRSVEKQVENEFVRLRAGLEDEHRKGLAPILAQGRQLKKQELQKLRITFNRSIAGRYSRKQIHTVVKAMRNMLADPASKVLATEQNAHSKAMLSWRVHLLPYIGEKALYDQFRLNEPWDSKHNLPLSKKMPSVYRGFFGKPGASKTRLMSIDMPGSLGRGGRLFALDNIRDPHSDTLAIIIAGTKHAVTWTSPNDFVATADNFADKMKWVPKPTYWVGTIEGAALDVRFDGDYKTFAAMMTINGKEENAVDAMIMEKFQLMKTDK